MFSRLISYAALGSAKATVRRRRRMRSADQSYPMSEALTSGFRPTPMRPPKKAQRPPWNAPCDPRKRSTELRGMPFWIFFGLRWLLGVGLANPEFRTTPMTELPGLRSPERPPCDPPKRFTNLRDKSCLERHSSC